MSSEEKTEPPRRAIAILFPDEWVAFSPTVIRLARRLQSDHDVTVVAIHTGRVAENESLDGRTFRLCQISPASAKPLRRLALLPAARLCALAIAAKRLPPNAQIIAVDVIGTIAASLAGRSYHFLSLEISPMPALGRWIARGALSYIFPNVERARLQMGSCLHTRPLLLLPNAPDISRLRSTPRMRGLCTVVELVHLGHAIPAHGLTSMLRLIERRPDLRLTLKGLIPPATAALVRDSFQQMVSAGRLRLEPGYLDEAEIPDYLSRFDIGLCLYDAEVVGARNWNYLTSPSGKMFEYFRAGLPAVGSDFPGLQPIRIHSAGVLCRSLSADELSAAIETIQADYDRYAEGALAAARIHDFAAAAERIAEHLRREPSR